MASQDHAIVLLGRAADSERAFGRLVGALGFDGRRVRRCAALGEYVGELLEGEIGAVFLDLDDPSAGGLDANVRLQALAPDTPIVAFRSSQPGGGVDPERVAAWLEIAARRRAARAAMAHRATHDRLTNLANLWLLEDRFEQALARARRARGSGAVFFVDLDRFKAVNDELGHDAGNEVLRAVARRLAASLRKTDTVARFGGDEFVVLVEPMSCRRQAQIVRDKIRASIERPIETECGPASIGASIGVAFFPDHGASLRELIEAADRRMLVAKSEKKRMRDDRAEGVAPSS